MIIQLKNQKQNSPANLTDLSTNLRKNPAVWFSKLTKSLICQS